MIDRRSMFVLFVSIGVGVAACGGKLAPTEESDLVAKVDEPDPPTKKDPPTTSSPSSPGSGAPGSPGKPIPPATNSCTWDGSGGSSSGATSGKLVVTTCTQIDYFSCDSGSDVEVSCNCTAINGVWQKSGLCSCGDQKFPFDCAKGCSPTAEVYAQCNVPTP